MSTRIFTEPSGAEFTVDGQRYRGSAIFFWPERSAHTLSIPAVIRPDQYEYTRYTFDQWQDSSGTKMAEGTTLTITADANTPSYRGLFRVFHAIELRMPDIGLPFDCTQGPDYGKIYLSAPSADSCYAQTSFVWAEAGTNITVQVHPPAGWVFLGWIGLPAGLDGPNLSFTLTSPVSMLARFGPATRVTFSTIPEELRLYVDSQEVSTPISFGWAPKSVHRIGAVEPQRHPAGGVWMFESWSDGGAVHHDYTTGDSHVPVQLVARFVPGHPVTVRSNPTGLPLIVDGVTTSSWRFTWGSGLTHTISAPAEAVDSSGRRYVFREWSSGPEPTQQVKATADDQKWIAEYDGLNRLTVRSSQPGAPLVVNGTPCAASCTFHRTPGTELEVSAPATVSVGEGARLEFESWSDGGAATHLVKMEQAQQTLTANYRASYRLTVLADPAGAADLRYEPGSPDGFFAGGTSVQVTAQPHTGFSFLRWEGDLSGTAPSGVVIMSGPRIVRAMLDQMSYIAPAGVRNAAGLTPESGVAPGSIISVYGGRMAAGTEVGPASPLAQTLAKITVKVADRLLPLFFVSPEQINALLPSDLPEGDHTLTVRWEGHSILPANFRVVRNAPGLFAWVVDGVPYALALHANGSLISADAPASPGEMVTLFGTGLGPYQGQAIDGLAIPAGLLLPLADPVKVWIQGRETGIDPEFAGAATGQVGVAAIRFRAPDSTGLLSVRIAVNGKESNTVALPVR